MYVCFVLIYFGTSGVKCQLQIHLLVVVVEVVSKGASDCRVIHRVKALNPIFDLPFHTLSGSFLLPATTVRKCSFFLVFACVIFAYVVVLSSFIEVLIENACALNDVYMLDTSVIYAIAIL